MSLYVLDTDILTLYSHGTEPVLSRVKACRADELGITVITVEEQLTGWYGLVRKAKDSGRRALAYAALADAVPFLAAFRILPYTEAATARHDALKAMRLNLGGMDPHIAAIAMEAGATLVTRNVRDFSRVPGLKHEDWAA